MYFEHILNSYKTGFELIWRFIHSIIRETRYSCSVAVSSLCWGNLCHFSIQPRQQVAVACWAMKTGCPCIGVCLPSFAGSEGATISRIKSQAWEWIVLRPLSLIYLSSFVLSLNLLLNFDFASLSKILKHWAIPAPHINRLIGNINLCAI